MSLIWLATLSFVVYVFVKYNFIKRFLAFQKLIKLSRTLSGPPPLALLRHLKKDCVLPWMKENTLKYGPLFRIWFGPDLTVMITDPDDAKTILSNNSLLFKSSNYQNVSPWLGDGLLTSGGNKWKKQRKILTPAFHFNILSGFHGAINDCCDVLIAKLDKVSDERDIDFYPYITLFAMDVICETAMGTKINAQEDDESEYVQAVQKICQILHRRNFSAWQRIPFLFAMSSACKEMNSTLKILHGQTNSVIKLRRSLLDRDPTEVLEDDDVVVGGKRRLAFLDILLMAQKTDGVLTDENIREEVDTFMFEGHDTTSSAIGFCVYLLSQNQDVQKNLFEEVKDLSDEKDVPMKYLEAVIKETLRIYPSVPMYSREIKEDMMIGKTMVPAGTAVAILAYMLHRNESIYPNPEKFDPERFINQGDKHAFAHVAFSAGPRNCIGQRFAMLELKSTLSKLVRRFQFLPVEGFNPILTTELILKSSNGIHVRLRKRSLRT